MNKYEESCSFAVRQFSTLTLISGYQKCVVSYKNTRYQKVCVYKDLSLYISSSDVWIFSFNIVIQYWVLGVLIHWCRQFSKPSLSYLPKFIP